jgi:hypothetical protein
MITDASQFLSQKKLSQKEKMKIHGNKLIFIWMADVIQNAKSHH